MASVGVDFDGVVHTYDRGWDDGTIYGEPIPGAFEGIRTLMEMYSVFIFTSRNTGQVADWIFERGKFNIIWEPSLVVLCDFWNERNRLLITNRKLPAVAYIDDRAIRFTDWKSETLDRMIDTIENNF